MLTLNDQQYVKKLEDELFGPMFQTLGQMPERTPELWRSVIDGYDPWRNGGAVPLPEVAAYHAGMELRPGLHADVAVPAGAGPFPVFVITHGPGLSAGSPHLSRRLTMDVAAASYLAVTPDFRLAPEHPFPAGYEDMRAALYWAKDHAAELGGDPSRLVLWGDAMGTALALGLVLGLRDEPDAPQIKAFIGTGGEYDLKEPRITKTPSVRWYHGGEAERVLADKRVSPLLHLEPGMELPDILLMAGSADWTLPNTLDLARRLSECAIPFQLHVLEGMPHDFMFFPELDGMQEGHRLMFEFLARSV